MKELPLSSLVSFHRDVMIQKETQQEEVEAAVFGGAAAVSQKLHMWTVTHPSQIPDLFLSACPLCHFIPV